MGDRKEAWARTKQAGCRQPCSSLSVYLATCKIGILSLGSQVGFVCALGERYGTDCELPTTSQVDLMPAAVGACGPYIPTLGSEFA